MCASVGDPQGTQNVFSAAPLTNRRSFLAALVALGSVFVGALLSVPLIRFALFPLIRRTTELKSSPVGAVTEFSSLTEPSMRTIQIELVDGWRKAISEKAVYVTKDAKGNLSVLTSVCPHLGCVALWNGERKRFVCPCHKGNFAADGARISGPPPRGLDPLPVKVEGGKLWVKYQYYRQLVPTREVIG